MQDGCLCRLFSPPSLDSNADKYPHLSSWQVIGIARPFMPPVNSSALSEGRESFPVCNPSASHSQSLEVGPGSSGNLWIHGLTSVVVCFSDVPHPRDEPLENAGLFLYRTLTSLDSTVPWHFPKDCIWGCISYMATNIWCQWSLLYCAPEICLKTRWMPKTLSSEQSSMNFRIHRLLMNSPKDLGFSVLPFQKWKLIFDICKAMTKFLKLKRGSLAPERACYELSHSTPVELSYFSFLMWCLVSRNMRSFLFLQSWTWSFTPNQGIDPENVHNNCHKGALIFYLLLLSFTFCHIEKEGMYLYIFETEKQLG